MCSKRKKREAGITLIEIMVVLGILALLAFVSGTWLFAHAGRADLKRATRNLVTSFHYAKNEAIKQNRSFKVTVNATGWSVAQDNENATEVRRFDAKSLRTPVTVDSNKDKFVFTKRGLPTNTSWGTVILSIPGGEKFEVTVSKAGARIKVE